MGLSAVILWILFFLSLFTSLVEGKIKRRKTFFLDDGLPPVFRYQTIIRSQGQGVGPVPRESEGNKTITLHPVYVKIAFNISETDKRNRDDFKISIGSDASHDRRQSRARLTKSQAQKGHGKSKSATPKEKSVDTNATKRTTTKPKLSTPSKNATAKKPKLSTPTRKTSSKKPKLSTPSKNRTTKKPKLPTSTKNASTKKPKLSTSITKASTKKPKHTTPTSTRKASTKKHKLSTPTRKVPTARTTSAPKERMNLNPKIRDDLDADITTTASTFGPPLSPLPQSLELLKTSKYNFTIVRRKTVNPPEPTIMVLDTPTKKSKKAKKKKTPPRVKAKVKGSSTEAKPVVEEEEEESMVKVTKQAANMKDRPPPNIVLPITGDTSELDDYEFEEEEEDDIDFTNKQSIEDSSEEGDTADEEVKKVPVPVTTNATTMSQIKGETGDLAQNDAGKKKKKKKKKKAQFKFVPAPLGPKADLIIRFDKVHKNIKEIQSIVKGVFSDYVVNRPNLEVQVYGKKKVRPFHSQYYKHDFPPPKKEKPQNVRPMMPPPPPLKPFIPLYSFPDLVPRHPPSSQEGQLDVDPRPRYPPPSEGQLDDSHQDQLTKRVLEVCNNDDERCNPFPFRRHRPRPPQMSERQENYQMPHPIYIESFDDSEEEEFPFDDLPPLKASSIVKEESWVKTWDKDSTGLPEVASAEEALASRKRNRKKQNLKL